MLLSACHVRAQRSVGEKCAPIIGQPKQQYAQSLFPETRAHESNTADQSEPECDAEYSREIKLTLTMRMKNT